MGLDTTHGCWNGAYSAFGRWRKRIAQEIGLDLMSMEGFEGTNKWEILKPDPLHVLLSHSDCDGEIAWEECAPLAARLEELLPKLDDEAGGHIGNFKEKTEIFIEGLRLAAANKENVEFR